MQQDKGASASQSGIPSAFTPGPWEWAYFGETYGYSLVGACPDHSSVRQSVSIAHDTPDGKLAAAAPELLEALERFMANRSVVAGLPSAAAAARAAIAKARGAA